MPRSTCRGDGAPAVAATPAPGVRVGTPRGLAWQGLAGELGGSRICCLQTESRCPGCGDAGGGMKSLLPSSVFGPEHLHSNWEIWAFSGFSASSSCQSSPLPKGGLVVGWLLFPLPLHYLCCSLLPAVSPIRAVLGFYSMQLLQSRDDLWGTSWLSWSGTRSPLGTDFPRDCPQGGWLVTRVCTGGLTSCCITYSSQFSLADPLHPCALRPDPASPELAAFLRPSNSFGARGFLLRAKHAGLWQGAGHPAPNTRWLPVPSAAWRARPWAGQDSSWLGSIPRG